jgi:UDP-glucose 4-epimerase
MSRLLITGGTGYIGSKLIHFLSKKNFEVVVTSRKASADSILCKTAILDLRNKNAVKKLFKEYNPQYIINLVGTKFIGVNLKQEMQYYKDNQKIVQNILDSANNLSDLRKFITLGSCDEYGESNLPFSEAMHEEPKNNYGAFKLSVTERVSALSKSHSLPGLVLRPSVVYGPGQLNEMFIPSLFKAGILNKEFNMTIGQQSRDFLFVGDLIIAIFKFLSSDEDINGEVFNIAHGSSVKLKDIAEKVEDLFNRKFVNYGIIKYRSDEVMNYCVDIKKSKVAVNWEPKISIESGLDIINRTYNVGI